LTDVADIARARAGRPAVALAVGAALLAIPRAFVVGDLTASVVLGPAASLTGLGPVSLVLLLAVVSVAAVVAETAAARVAAGSSIAARARLRASLIADVATWSPLASQRASAGEVASTIVDRVEGLDPWFARYPLARARLLVVPAAVVAAVAPVSWLVAVILVACGVLLPVLMSLIGARAREMGLRQLEEAASLTGLLLDRVRGLATLRALGAVDAVADDIRDTGDRLRRRTMSVLAVAFLSSAVLELFASVGIALAAVFVGLHLLGWASFGGEIGLAGGLAVLVLAPEFFQPFRDFAAAYHDRAAAMALADRAAVVFSPDVPRMPSGERTHAGAPGPVGLDLDQVTLRSPVGAGTILDAVSLSVSPGERVAIVGDSGAGKSALLAVAAGLVADVEGEVRINGRPLATGAPPTVAWVAQEPFVAAGSVRANLASSTGIPGPRAASEALRVVGLDRVVARMPRGSLTPLGETGAGMSRGELRRLTIARALISGAPLVLADEPTADLDAETAAAVTDALLAATAGRTLVVATHDAALAARMDRSVRLDGGRVVAIAGAEAPA
jgi:ATP-binding cassette subfamily C protein CydD